MFTLRIRILFLIFLTCVIAPVYGTSEALGLKINWTRFSIPPSHKSPDIESEEPIVCKHLTDIECEPWSDEIETVTYNLYAQGSGIKPLDVSAVDTDTEEESEGKIQTIEKNNHQAVTVDDKMNNALPEATKEVSETLGPINRSRHSGNARQSDEYAPLPGIM